MRKLGYILILLLSLQNVAAYIDPGTGSAIAGSLWPLIVAAVSAILAFFAKIFWHPLKNAVLRKKDK